jgi:formamidopyrimidine-DNA glycosylase
VPELPEVETVRRDIDKEFSGKRIKRVTATGARTIRRHTEAAEFVSRVEGRRLTGIDRRGKYLMLRLDSRDVVVAHLGMSGQFLSTDPKAPPIKHTHVVLTFTGGPELRFVDPRTFGEVFVSTPEELEKVVPELAHLGFDPLEDAVTWTDFATRLGARRAKLKPLLMDQRFVAGIGNIYADEILFAAGLRHDRPSDQLTPQEVRRLYRSMMETLQEAIRHRGSSLADEQYRDLSGATGDFQKLHNVYARQGAPCTRCRGTIVRVKTNGRSSFYCPECQV